MHRGWVRAYSRISTSRVRIRNVGSFENPIVLLGEDLRGRKVTRNAGTVVRKNNIGLELIYIITAGRD